jgi:hypothetical protein
VFYDVPSFVIRHLKYGKKLVKCNTALTFSMGGLIQEKKVQGCWNLTVKFIPNIVANLTAAVR